MNKEIISLVIIMESGGGGGGGGEGGWYGKKAPYQFFPCNFFKHPSK